MANVSVSRPVNSFPSKVASDRVSAGMDLRKVTTPILTHLLRNDMRFPTLFLIRCKLTVGRLKKRIDPRFPQELIDIAALPLWVYINLKEKIGQQRAFEVMRIAILTGGLAQWNFQYGAAEKERTFKNLCDAEIEVNKTGFTQWNTLEVVERSERRFEIKITRCLYHELTVSLGRSGTDAGHMPGRQCRVQLVPAGQGRIQPRRPKPSNRRRQEGMQLHLGCR